MKRTTVLTCTAATVLALAACGDDSSQAGVGGSFVDEQDAEITDPPVVPVEETADLVDPEGSRLGLVTLTDADTGAQVHVQANGLPPGTHPLALYEVAACTASATSEDPTRVGTWTGTGRALPGTTLPELVVGAEGVGEISSVVGSVELRDLLDDDGTTLVVGSAAADGSPAAAAADQVPGIACAAVGG